MFIAQHRCGTGLRGELIQVSILSRHFFARLFRNEVIDFENQLKERLIAILAFLTVIVGWFTQLLLFKYNLMPDANLSWQEKNYIFLLMMIIFGIVALLEWELLFLDREDYRNLIPLPIKIRTILLAKLASFIALVGLFSAAMASLSSVVSAIFLVSWRSNSPLYFIRYVLAHFASAFAACFCVLFACVFLNFFLMVILPFRVYQRVSLLIRFILIAIAVFILLGYLAEPSVLDRSFHSLAYLKDADSPFVFRFPPLWFVGLGEVLLGTRDGVFIALSKISGLALMLSLSAFVLSSILSYYRYALKTSEAPKSRRRSSQLRDKIGELFQNVILRHPEERAVAGFFSQTIRTSPRPRMVLVNVLAVAGGIIIMIIAVNRASFVDRTPDNVALLVPPLIISLALMAGLRMAADIPVGLEARWVFRVTETVHADRYVSGLKKAIFFHWNIPLIAAIFFIYFFIWRDWRPAFSHAIFIAMVSGLCLEALFFRFRKIPFACPKEPHGSKLGSRGLPYLLASASFVAIGSFVERILLRNTGFFAVFLAFSACLWMALRFLGLRFLRSHPVQYDEESEPIIITLGDTT